MSLLLIGDSQIGRVWRLVSNDREIFRTGSFVSVIKDSQRIDAIGAINAQVIMLLYFWSIIERFPFFVWLDVY